MFKARLIAVALASLCAVGTASASTSGSFAAVTKAVISNGFASAINTSVDLGATGSSDSLAYNVAVNSGNWTTDVEFMYNGNNFLFSNLNTAVDSATPLSRSLGGNALTLSWQSKTTSTPLELFGQHLTAENTKTYFSYSLAPVPEPETYAMFLAGLGMLGVVARRRQQQA